MKNLIATLLFISFSAYAQNSPTKSEGQICTDCEQNTDPSESIKSLKTLLGPLLRDDQATCKIQDIGTNRNINIEDFDSPTSVEQKYNIKRTKEKEFEVTLNLSFSDERHIRSRAVSFSKIWREKVQKCLAGANNWMAGPNGEKVKFLVYQGQKDRQEPPRVAIKIGNIVRSHSRHWEEDIDCSTVTHEILHLVGLPDEYAETTIGYIYDPLSKQWNMVQRDPEKTAYDCRRLYGENSIMAYHDIAFYDASSTWLMKREICQCNQSDGCEAYNQKMNLWRQKILKEIAQGRTENNSKNTYPRSCPAGFITSGKGWSVGLNEEVKRAYDQGAINQELMPTKFSHLDINTPVIYSFHKVQAKSLLEARHFNAIVFPGCVGKNIEYYGDSANAYRTSKSHGGNGCKK